ncbi:DUF4177 domain-containing protein [Neptunitalea lumnitzerae]|uniref:DUF4177 domain-containing protein n=1 Tax=Neptunitalea lumnitzerae TaxID=2965509 RepID=A0ABQ5MHS4_9FLAO|nr:DUF4177 domain-containing protein [Neptunitalea sp. Y10]GLB48943.1 hypothetical protein Y10_13110 [Neptunitalea sp. Y10]
MREYKIISQVLGPFKVMKEDDFIKLINQEAKIGWKVVNVIGDAAGNLKAFMERDR